MMACDCTAEHRDMGSGFLCFSVGAGALERRVQPLPQFWECMLPCRVENFVLQC